MGKACLKKQERPKARPLAPVIQVVNAKGKFLKEIQRASAVNTNNKKAKQPYCWYGEILSDMDRRPNQPQVPFIQSLIQSKVLTLLQSYEVWEVRKLQESLKLAKLERRGYGEEENPLHNIKVQGEKASADTKAAAIYTEDLAKILNEGGYTK